MCRKIELFFLRALLSGLIVGRVGLLVVEFVLEGFVAGDASKTNNVEESHGPGTFLLVLLPFVEGSFPGDVMVGLLSKLFMGLLCGRGMPSTDVLEDSRGFVVWVGVLGVQRLLTASPPSPPIVPNAECVVESRAGILGVGATGWRLVARRGLVVVARAVSFVLVLRTGKVGGRCNMVDETNGPPRSSSSGGSRGESNVVVAANRCIGLAVLGCLVAEEGGQAARTAALFLAAEAAATIWAKMPPPCRANPSGFFSNMEAEMAMVVEFMVRF